VLANWTRCHLRQPSIDALLVKRMGAVCNLPHVVPSFEFLQAHVAHVLIILELPHKFLFVEGSEHGASSDAFGCGTSVSALRAIVDIGARITELMQQFVTRYLICRFGGGGSMIDGVGH